jgi:hypothetical protein
VKITHVVPDDWEDTEEVEVIQPSDLPELAHAVDLAEPGVAGEAISALRALWRDDDGRMYLLDAADAAHIELYAGIAVNSALPDEAVRAQRSGMLEADGLSLVPGPVWLGAGGALTQTPPESGFDLYLGFSTEEHRLLLSPTEPIELIEE